MGFGGCEGCRNTGDCDHSWSRRGRPTDCSAHFLETGCPSCTGPGSGPSTSANGSMVNTASREGRTASVASVRRPTTGTQTGGAIGSTAHQPGRHVGLADQTTFMEGAGGEPAYDEPDEQGQKCDRESVSAGEGGDAESPYRVSGMRCEGEPLSRPTGPSLASFTTALRPSCRRSARTGAPKDGSQVLHHLSHDRAGGARQRQ